jgi:hypothetical protein
MVLVERGLLSSASRQITRNLEGAELAGLSIWSYIEASSGGGRFPTLWVVTSPLP